MDVWISQILETGIGTKHCQKSLTCVRLPMYSSKWIVELELDKNKLNVLHLKFPLAYIFYQCAHREKFLEWNFVFPSFCHLGRSGTEQYLFHKQIQK